MKASVLRVLITEHLAHQTQKQLASAAGLAPTTVSRVMQGSISRVSLGTGHAILRGLGLTYEDYKRLVNQEVE